MKEIINKKRMTFFLIGLFFCLTLFILLPQVSATLTSTEGDGWADVDMAWFAKTRHGGAGGFRASVGIDPASSSGQDGYFTGGWTWPSGNTYEFELVYTAFTGHAELYVTGQNGGAPICEYTVGASNGKIGINARSAPEVGMSTIVENIKFNGVTVSPDDSVISTSTAGESAVRHLLLEGADLSNDFTIEGDFTFYYGSSTNDECPSLIIDIENACVPDIPVNLGYDPDATCSNGARWRNFRLDGNGWELAVGENIGSYDPGWSNEDFVYSGDYFFTPDGPNTFTYTYNAITGDQTIEAIVNGGLFSTVQNNGNLGSLDYLQFDVVGRNGQTVEFNNVILTVDGTPYFLCDYEAGGWTSYYINTLDFSNGFTITGEVYLTGQATSQEGSKINICVGTSSCTPKCRNVEDNIEFCSIQEAIDAVTTDDGETIEVYAGTHLGNIIVYKEVTIVSELGAASTIIDASTVDYSSYQNAWGKGINYAWAETNDPGLLKNGFMIWNDSVTIDGFTITNALWSSQYNRGIGILIGSIHTTYAGFIPWNIDQWGGIVSNPDEPTPTEVVIKNNIIDGASDGVYNWMSNGNIFEYNTIINSVAVGGVGIQCYEGGTDNIIRNNNIDNVDGPAISICGAWPDVLLDVSNTQIYENTITNNNYGIQFYNMFGSNVDAYENDIFDNNKGVVVEGVGGALVGHANYNNIVGNTIGVENTAPDGVFDAICNWWGDTSGPSSVGPGTGDPVSSNVIYCPWLTDEYPYGDCTGGAICWNHQTGEYFCSIQAAIDDVDTLDGHTIEVFAVTDVEQVNVYKSVTIYGQGIGNTIIQSPDVLTDYFTTSNNNYPIIFINNVDDVIIHNLTVDGVGKGNANYRFVGIGIYQAGAILKDLDVINVKDTPFSGAQHGVGIYGWSDGTGISHDVIVKDCFVYDYQKTGIALGGSDFDIDVNNCEITGVGPTTVTAQNGIQVSNSATGSITENMVSGCSYTGASWAASGILPYLSGGVLDISNNIISENQANIYLCSCSADIIGNSITASASGTGQTYFYGVIGDPGDPPLIPDASPLDEETPSIDKTTYVITCEDNMFTGDGSSGGVGIGVYAGMYGTYDIEFTAMHNNVLDWGYGFELYQYDPNNLISANINYNNIIGNDYGIYNWVSNPYDCTCNWYGDISGPMHPTNPLGIGDPVSDYVIFVPWLNLPFEDPDSICEVGLCQDIVYIDDDFTSSTPGWYIDHFSSIQIALDRLETGGTAIIYDGEYDEEVFIDDDYCDNTGITIKGAYETFPLEESAILLGNITICVNDVTINYLEFKPNPDDAAILVEDGVTGTTIELNKFFREECESDLIIGVESLGTSLVNAEYNWWGVPDGPYNGVLDNGKLSNGLGVTVIGDVHVEPWIGIHAAADISDLHVMVGDSIIFDAVDSFGYGPDKNELEVSFLWDFDDDSWSMEEQISYSYDQPGVYKGYLRVSANDITIWSRTMYDWDYFTIVVSEPGQALGANADGNDLGGYEGIIEEPVTFYGIATGGVPGYTFEWDINGQILTGQTVEYSYTEAGTYTVELTVTDSEFHTATDTATVYIAGPGELVAKAGGPYDTIASEPVYLTGDASGGKAPYTFSWNFGDGSEAITAQNPIHIYETEGTYIVTLTVTDATDAIDEAITTVTVNGNHGQPEILHVNGGLGIKATVITADLPVDWTISIEGNYVFGRTTATGTIAPNEEEIIRAPYVFGLGNVEISIKANDAVSKHTAFMFGPMVLFLK